MAGLFPGEKLYDDSNCAELMGDGKEVIVNGERRLLSRKKPLGATTADFSTPIKDTGIKIKPRSEWSGLLKEQDNIRSRVSDYQNFPPHDQNGLPTCWSNGPAHAATTMRVMMGLPYAELSANSVAVPISGGHSGGWEGEAIKYAGEHGWVSSKLWPNNSTDRKLISNPECQADRLNHKALEWIDLGSKFENYATAALLSLPMAVAFDDWSHVVAMCDLVEIEPGRFGLRIRNNWGKWGAANRFGFYGYAVFAEGARSHGCPSSGFALRQVTPSVR